MSGDAWKEGGIDATGKHGLDLCPCLVSFQCNKLIIYTNHALDPISLMW